MVTYTLLLHLLHALVNLILAGALAVELVRKVAESLFLVHHAALFIDVVELETRPVALLLLELRHLAHVAVTATHAVIVTGWKEKENAVTVLENNDTNQIGLTRTFPRLRRTAPR